MASIYKAGADQIPRIKFYAPEAINWMEGWQAVGKCELGTPRCFFAPQIRAGIHCFDNANVWF